MAKRVLIVNDSFGDRLVLRDALASVGFQVVGEAKNIEESLEKYEKLRPDIVMMDATVPDVDGVSAVMRILRQDHEANVVMCVSRGQRNLAMEAVRVGAKDFITKPFNFRQLRRALQNLR